MATYTMLQNGSSGSEVKKLQQTLVDAGYDVGSAGVDGIYGSATQEAVRKYQQDNGLDVDGIAGEQTLGSLYGNSAPAGSQNAPANSNPQNPGAANDSGDIDYSKYQYDPAADTAYQQALAALQQAQKAMPTYQATYDQQLQDLYNQIVNREKFSYNLNEDALYQQYANQYTLMGQMAMMDTMGQAAALTGGYGSSYGQAVGQQAYQGYLQQLNNIVPELYGMARDQYNQEGQELLNQYAMLGDMADTEYARYQDQLDQYWQNLSFAKEQADTAYDQGYSNWYNSYQNAYQDQRDQVADQQWQTEFDEAKRQYDQEYEFAMQQYADSQKGGGYSSGGTGGNNTSSNYDTHGYTVEQIKEIQRAAGIEEDGIWGPDTEKAYQDGFRPGTEVKEPEPVEPTASDYADWDAGDWEGYFSRIRQSEGWEAAQEELEYFTSNGLIPKNMVAYASSGARGGQMGH